MTSDKPRKPGKGAKPGRVGKPGTPGKPGKAAKASKPGKAARGRRPPSADAGAPSAAPEERASRDLPEQAGAAPATAPRRPPGQRLYDMPYSAVAPRMVNPELGLHNLVARAGHNAAYGIDVTLLDAPDHRLIRSGVLLAHRVLDERGEWYLTAPDWQPLLPKDRIEPMGHADLPDELVDLIRPLRRRAPLGPVAALHCDRREFALRDEAGATLALLRDDKVTVRRGGLTTARYREVMLTPVGSGLTEDQIAWLDRSLLGVGSTEVPRFPRLVTRLGAPANGPGDFPEDTPFDPAAPLKRFVAQLLGLRLRRIVAADLAVRGGDGPARARLVEQVRLLQAELAGLAAAAPAEWVDDLGDGLSWLVEPAAPDAADPLPGRLRSERYLALLDQLVAAARAPKLGAPASQPAGEVVDALLAAVVRRIAQAVDEVAGPEQGADPDGASTRDAWDEVDAAVAAVDDATALAGHLRPAEVAALSRRLTRSRRALTRIRTQQLSGQQALARVAGLSAAEAFAAGREFERQTLESARAREEFLRAWSRASHKLRRAPWVTS